MEEHWHADQELARDASLIAQCRQVETHIFTLIARAITRQRQYPRRVILAEAKLGLLTAHPQARNGPLSRKNVAESDAIIICACFHRHRAPSTPGPCAALGDIHEQAVICIVNVTYFCIGQRVIVYPAARLTAHYV